MKNEKETISVIIPTYNYPETFFRVLESLYNQELLPNEIIIIDSTESKEISKIIENFKEKYPNKINLVYYHSEHRLNPGEARNKGFELSKSNYISFLDSKTIPQKNWLIQSFYLLKNNNFDIVFGNTLYVTNSSEKQKLIKDLVYGNIPHITTPGSILHKKNFNKNKFIEGVRTVDDMFWRNYYIKNNFTYSSPKNHNLVYDAIPDSLFSMQKRFFIYSLNLININIQEKTKDIYFALLCILLFLLVPRWNYLYYYFDIEFLYLPHVTKLFFTIFISITLIIICMKYFLKLFSKLILTYYTIIIISFLLSFIFVYNWNYKIAELIMNSSLYIPHITKFYLLLLVITHFGFRAFILPLKRNVNISSYRWLKLGIFGMTLDYFKSPGYLIGSIIGLKSLFVKKT